jgi:hypothetical protein
MEVKGVNFSIATRSDEPDIRRLLRENAMEGQLHISLEREPDAFAADFSLAREQGFVVARDASTGEAIGICERVVHDCYVNGSPAHLPYIGALRVSAQYRNRIKVIKGGFAKLRAITGQTNTLPFALTSIAQENKTALRLLCADLPGLPRYEPVGSFATFLLASREKTRAAESLDAKTLASAANEWNVQHQFAMAWQEDEIERLTLFGLSPESRFGIRRSGQLCGSVGLWDQRAYRQAVVRRYPVSLSALRPFYNLASKLLNRPLLPKKGEAMNVAVASHFSWFDGREETFSQLVEAALSRASNLGISATAFGFAVGSQCYQLMRECFPRAMEFKTQLFKVFWPDDVTHQTPLDGRPLHPELGVL